jgi:hypothetical protein
LGARKFFVGQSVLDIADPIRARGARNAGDGENQDQATGKATFHP